MTGFRPGIGSAIRVASLLAAMTVAALLVVPGCGAENALVGGACAGGYTECGVTCVDVRTSSNHCGACGRECAAGVACVAGICGGPVDATTPPDSSADASIADGGTDADAPSDGDVTDATAEGGDTADAEKDAAWRDGAADSAATDADRADAADACEPPFDSPMRCGSCTTACGPAAPHCAPTPNGGFACVPLCAAPLISCSGACVNLDTSPQHCGACGRLCASSFCLDGLCQGSVGRGSVVFIGDDGDGVLPGTALARLISNAVLIRRRSVVQVLSFERYALPSAIARVREAVIDGATQAGRTAVVTAIVTDAEVPTRLAGGAVHVLLVHDQVGAPRGALAALGSSWAASLAAFVASGGVVVAPLSVVGAGVITPFASGDHSARFTTTETTSPMTAVIVDDSQSSGPAVVHKVVP